MCRSAPYQTCGPAQSIYSITLPNSSEHFVRIRPELAMKQAAFFEVWFITLDPYAASGQNSAFSTICKPPSTTQVCGKTEVPLAAPIQSAAMQFAAQTPAGFNEQQVRPLTKSRAPIQEAQ